MSVFNLPPLSNIVLKDLLTKGWRWKGLALYQKTGVLDYTNSRQGPIRLIPPKDQRHHLEDYECGIITKGELKARLNIP
jgi:hypothetical protein